MFNAEPSSISLLHGLVRILRLYAKRYPKGLTSCRTTRVQRPLGLRLSPLECIIQRIGYIVKPCRFMRFSRAIHKAETATKDLSACFPRHVPRRPDIKTSL